MIIMNIAICIIAGIGSLFTLLFSSSCNNCCKTEEIKVIETINYNFSRNKNRVIAL